MRIINHFLQVSRVVSMMRAWNVGIENIQMEKQFQINIVLMLHVLK